MYHGVLNIYKEKGFTSHDVVAKLRGILGQKKIGHTGTLDPDAEGVLPVCLGKATGLCELLTEKEKTYRAVMLLGTVTDTQDAGGSVLSRSPVTVSEERVREIVRSFTGTYMQTPPMYSAVKYNGKRLYTLARAGVTVERTPRKVTIYRMEILDMRLPRVTLEIQCSRGTYIRTLCEDMGKAAGCGGCMERLLRTGSGQFSLSDSLKLENVRQLKEQGRLGEVLIPIQSFFAEYPVVTVLPEGDRLVRNGNAFLPEMTGEKTVHHGSVRVWDSEKHFIGVYEYDPSRERYCPVKMFLESD